MYKQFRFQVHRQSRSGRDQSEIVKFRSTLASGCPACFAKFCACCPIISKLFTSQEIWESVRMLQNLDVWKINYNFNIFLKFNLTSYLFHWPLVVYPFQNYLHQVFGEIKILILFSCRNNWRVSEKHTWKWLHWMYWNEKNPLLLTKQ